MVDKKERRVVAVGSNCGAPSMVRVMGGQTESRAVDLLLSDRPARRPGE